MVKRPNAGAALPIVYGAMVLSVFVYAAVLEAVTVDPRQVFPEMFLWMLLALAAGSTALSFILPRLLLRRSGAGGQAETGQRQVAYILRWALSESVAIYGLLTGFMNGPRAWVLAFFCWALVLLAVHHPFRPERRP